MKTEELSIEGMSCSHCVLNVTKELRKLSGVIIEDVHIGSARVTYDETKLSWSDLTSAIANAGYTVTTNL